MVFDQGLAQRIRDYLDDTPAIIEKHMFGGLAFMAQEYMFIGVINDVLMARVGLGNYNSALQKKHVRIMDFTGKAMPRYIFIDTDGYESDNELHYWIETCLTFIRTLPPKKPQRKLKKKST